MSTWYDLYGTEPTLDRTLIEAGAGAGLDLGVVLNELPADGPCHPATLVLKPLALELSCETTGRALIVPNAGAAQRSWSSPPGPPGAGAARTSC